MNNIIAKFINFCTVHRVLIMVFCGGVWIGHVFGDLPIVPLILLILMSIPYVPGFITFVKRCRLAYRGGL